MPRYLADTSIWVWAKLRSALSRKLSDRYDSGELVTTAPVALELLHSSRDAPEYEETLATLDPLERLSLSSTFGDRSMHVQRLLAHTTHGAHRIGSIDYLIAAVAEEHGAVLWHADRDLARLCERTGQPQEHERLEFA